MVFEPSSSWKHVGSGWSQTQAAAAAPSAGQHGGTFGAGRPASDTAVVGSAAVLSPASSSAATVESGTCLYCWRGVVAISRAALGRLSSFAYSGSRFTDSSSDRSQIATQQRHLRQRSRWGSTFVFPVVRFSTMQMNAASAVAAATTAGAVVDGGGVTDANYWVFVVKFFYGPDLDDAWECVFSVPQLTLNTAVRTAGILIFLGLSGYLSLRLYRWMTTRRLVSRLDCVSPVHSIGSPLESMDYSHAGTGCDALDLDNLFLSSGRGPTGNCRTTSTPTSSSSSSSRQRSRRQVLDKEGQVYYSPNLSSAAARRSSSVNGSPHKSQRRRERARFLASAVVAGGGGGGTAAAAAKRASPKHLQKPWRSVHLQQQIRTKDAFASPGVIANNAGGGDLLAGRAGGARSKSSIFRRSSSRETDSYSADADASDTNYGRTSRSSSYSEYSGVYRRPGQRRAMFQRELRSASREHLTSTYDEFDSCWSSASSMDGDGLASRRDSGVTGASGGDGSAGLFMGSLPIQFDVRARHVARPSAMRFEEKHPQLCRWHQKPSCTLCGVDGAASSSAVSAVSCSSGIGTSLRRSLERCSRPRSSPDGATDDDELPELEMDDIFGSNDPSLIDVAALSEKQLHYIEKLKRLCGASPTPHFREDTRVPAGISAVDFEMLSRHREQSEALRGGAGLPSTFVVGRAAVAQGEPERSVRLRHSLSCDSAKSPQDWQNACANSVAAYGIESPPTGLSKVNSCESFLSYASTDLSSSLGCELDFELGGETESYLDVLESELHNVKQTCFDMDSNIVHLQVAKRAKEKAKAAPLLTAEEYQALAVELGLESDEDDQIAPYVASPVLVEGGSRAAGFGRPARQDLSRRPRTVSNSSGMEELPAPGVGVLSPLATRPQTPTQSVSSRPQSHMSLEWDHLGMELDAAEGMLDDSCPSSPRRGVAPPSTGATEVMCLEEELRVAESVESSRHVPSWAKQTHPAFVTIDSLTSSSAHSSLDPAESASLGATSTSATGHGHQQQGTNYHVSDANHDVLSPRMRKKISGFCNRRSCRGPMPGRLWQEEMCCCISNLHHSHGLLTIRSCPELHNLL